MKYLKYLITVSVFVSSYSFAAATLGDPDSLKIKLYRFAVSENGDCSNPKVVIDNSNDAKYVSMLSNPEFGSGDLDNGTYPCVMIEMSDHIKFSPDGNVGSLCDGNSEYTLDVCGGGGSYKKLDGTTGTCSGDNGADSSDNLVETKVVLYLSTSSTSSSGSNAFAPPTSSSDGSNGFKLLNALTVSGSEVGVFKVDGTNKVESDSGVRSYCEFSPPSFTFATK